MLANLLKLAGKEEEFEQRQKAKRVDRRFEEITSQDQFRRNCLDKQKGCAIAFLSGNQIVRLSLINVAIVGL